MTYGRWAIDNDHPTDVAAIKRPDLEAWITDILVDRKPSTADQRYRGMQAFFTWYESVEGGFTSPMVKMHRPKVPEQKTRIFSLEEVSEIIDAVDGSTFEGRRNEAIVRVLFDSGSRLTEIADLRWDPGDPEHNDLDMAKGEIHTHEKGRKDNTISLSDKTLTALDVYLRLRKRHKGAALPWLWLGERGRLTHWGVGRMLKHGGRRIGIANLHAHDFRHTASHHELALGMSESNVMNKRGWQSESMLRRYAKTTAGERSRAASRALALGDRV